MKVYGQQSRNADLRHEAKIQDADLAFRGADEVAWVGVGMQEACFQQLNEVAVEQGGAQLPHIPCCALTQLLACTHHSFEKSCTVILQLWVMPHICVCCAG